MPGADLSTPSILNCGHHFDKFEYIVFAMHPDKYYLDT